MSHFKNTHEKKDFWHSDLDMRTIKFNSPDISGLLNLIVRILINILTLQNFIAITIMTNFRGFEL